MEDTLSTIFKVLRWFKNDDPVTLSGANIDEKTLRIIMSATKRVSPLFISELDEDEIIVFSPDSVYPAKYWGSLAEYARDHFGATANRGMSGQAYAIPTTWKFKRSSIKSIKERVDEFIRFADENRNYKFYVTRIGCGYTGHPDAKIAALFAEALKLENVYLPQSFIDVLFFREVNFTNPSDLVPSTPTGTSSYLDDLKGKYSQYLMLLKKRYKSSPTGYRTMIESVEKLCDAIEESVTMTYRGLPSAAYTTLSKIMNEVFAKMDLFSKVEKGKTFYRMRIETDNLIKKTVDKKGMFHIPLSMRGIVKTQRYSVPGFPCLYMGEHIFGCWEELGRPNLSNCLVSKLTNTEDFYVFDFTIPAEGDWDLIKTDEGDYILPLRTILTFPLIIACTFRQSNHSAVFKHEYIVPQLLFQYIKEKGYELNKGKKKNERDIYGIHYTSVHIDNAGRDGQNEFCKSDGAFDNYVIPVIDIKHDYCERLADAFRITAPICEEFERGKESMPNGSVFDALETILKDLEPQKLEL